jgi:hypothetical protein
MRGAYRNATALFGLVAICLGIALLVETALKGGGIGYVLGLLFVGLGAGRLYLLARRK